MFLIPNSNTQLYDNIGTDKITLAILFERFKKESLTGFAKITFQNSFTFIFIHNGKVKKVLHEDDILGQILDGKGISACIKASRKSIGKITFNIVDDTLMKYLLSLPEAKMQLAPTLITNVDMKHLLEKIKNESFSGCMQLFVEKKVSFIFYDNGSAVGFFHDNCNTLDNNASDSQKIAHMPGTKIVTYACRFLPIPMTEDISATGEIQTLLNELGKSGVPLGKSGIGLGMSGTPINKSGLALGKTGTSLGKSGVGLGKSGLDMEYRLYHEKLRQVGISCLEDIGKTIIDRELSNLGGIGKIVSTNNIEGFISAFERKALALGQPNAVKKASNELRDILKSVR